MLLKKLQLSLPSNDTRYPFSIPVIESLRELQFETAVTFFVGENGSGKSTLLEAIATELNLDTIGRQDAAFDPTLAPARLLGNKMKFTWIYKTRAGFYMRAEDFFNYCIRLQEDIHRLEQERRRFSTEGKRTDGLSHAISSARGRYGVNLNSMSHGEAFLDLFKTKFVGKGLYLLDEPEAPLSPIRQMALISLMKVLVDEGAQFIIVTHSPILMAFPGATIFTFDQIPIKKVNYEDLEQVELLKQFLNNPESYLRHL